MSSACSVSASSWRCRSNLCSPLNTRTGREILAIKARKASAALTTAHNNVRRGVGSSLISVIAARIFSFEAAVDVAALVSCANKAFVCGSSASRYVSRLSSLVLVTEPH